MTKIDLSPLHNALSEIKAAFPVVIARAPIEPVAETFVVIAGSVSSGFKHYGPFPSNETAFQFGTENVFDTFETVKLLSA